jgi:hypothetical protein
MPRVKCYDHNFRLCYDPFGAKNSCTYIFWTKKTVFNEMAKIF